MYVLSLALIFIGEACAIGAELLVAHRFQAMTPLLWAGGIALAALGGLLLVLGYYWSYVHIQNIWIVAAVSIGSIVIIESILMYLFFSEAPTTGAIIGIILGVLGIIAALYIR